MVATMASGALMLGIDFLSKKIPAGEYGVLITLFSIVNLVPTIPFQMVFTQQTANALATGRDRQLRSTIRAAWLGTMLLWLAGSAVTLCFQKQIAANWHLSNPIALWLLLLVMLFSLFMPMFSGVMQGQQNFFWIGWRNIFNGAGVGRRCLSCCCSACGGNHDGCLPGCWRPRRLASANAVVVGRHGGHLTGGAFAAGDSADAGIWRDTIFLFRGHHVCGRIFPRRPDGDLRGGGNLVARAPVAGAAAGDGDVSENCSQRGEIGKTTCSDWFWRERVLAAGGAGGLCILGPW